MEIVSDFEVKVIDADDATGMVVEFECYYSVICAVTEVPFIGSVMITYSVGEQFVEFESFERWVNSLSTRTFTIELFCKTVFDKLNEVLSDALSLAVTVEAFTNVHGKARASMYVEKE